MTGVDVEHTKALADAEIDADLVGDGGMYYDPDASYPEYGNGTVRWAYRLGVDAGAAAVPALVAEVETLRERVRRDEPSMPAEYNGGFGGCTDRNPDVCACGQDTDEECSICGEVMESGEMCQMLTRPAHPGLPNHHRDQDWEHIVWHADCATKAQAEADEAQKQFEEWIGGSNDL